MEVLNSDSSDRRFLWKHPIVHLDSFVIAHGKLNLCFPLWTSSVVHSDYETLAIYAGDARSFRWLHPCLLEKQSVNSHHSRRHCPSLSFAASTASDTSTILVIVCPSYIYLASNNILRVWTPRVFNSESSLSFGSHLCSFHLCFIYESQQRYSILTPPIVASSESIQLSI